jgi:hypothetical protein
MMGGGVRPRGGKESAVTEGSGPYEFLLKPIVSDGERALILLQMARVAYTRWAELGGIQPDWDALSVAEKRRWGEAVRASFRAMLSLMGQVMEE